MRKKLFNNRLATGLVAAFLLAGCGPQSGDGPSGSAGQVKPSTGASTLNYYAASRVADQVSFGATPELVAELSRGGLEAWIDAQLALPVSLIESPSWVIEFDPNVRAAEDRAGRYQGEEFWRRALTEPGQLRLRVAWALFQFVPVANGRPYMRIEHFNLLQRHAFGNYGDFLHELSIHPAMGWYLNNETNRPTSPECPSCAPNENYARELVQLFSLGVVQLNADGSTVRDASGKALETYTQKDVEELARALTGWRFAPGTALPETNFNNAAKLMVPETWTGAHDRGSKTVLGRTLAAGGDAPQDLTDVIALLMAHPNTAPFVSLRLIQHLVTSNPSPQYISRVASVFRNNGQGVSGDMKAVVRAILVDAEARLGDLPGADSTRFGKLREPVLWYSAALRGLDCKQGLHWKDGGLVSPSNQNPDSPPSVFSFYQPSDRAPGSNLLAPEQKLLTTSVFTERLAQLNWLLTDSNNRSANTGAACDVAGLGRALSESPKAFIDVVSARWFRGAMPPTLRSHLQALATGQKSWDTPDEGALILLQVALTSPYFGAIK